MTPKEQANDRAVPAQRMVPFVRHLLGFAVAVMLPLLVLTGYDLWREAERAEAQAIEMVRGRAAEVADTVGQALDQARRLLDFMAQRTEIQTRDARACDVLLRGQMTLAPLLGNAYVADVRGNLVCSSIPSAGGQFPSAAGGVAPGVGHREWFAQALKTREIVISRPMTGQIIRRPILVVGRSLRDDSGAVVAVLGVSVDLHALSQVWQRAALPAGSAVVVHDDAGNIVARFPEPERFVGLAAAETLAGFLARHPAGAGEYRGLDGVQRVYAALALPRPGWHSVAGVPSERVFAQSRSDLGRALLGASAGALLALLLAWALSRRLAAPLLELVRSADAVAGGRHEVRVSESLPGEFRLVAREFNRMLDAQSATERQLRRATGFYEALSRTHRSVLRGGDRKSMCAGVCAACVDAGHALLASVWIRDGNAARLIASAGPVEAMYGRSDAELDLSDPLVAAAPGGVALLQGVPVVANDYQSDPRLATWRKRAGQQGVAAMAAVPLLRNGRAHGLLVLHVDEAGWFDDALVRLLVEMAGDLSFAFDNLERDEAHAQAERRAAFGQQRFQRLLRAAPLHAAVIGLPGRCLLDCNDAFMRDAGLRREQLLGRTLGELGVGFPAAASEQLEQLLDAGNGSVRDFELRVTVRGGRQIDLLANAERIDYDGKPALLLIGLDISERKRGERELRDSLQRFELAVATGHVWAWRPDSGLQPPAALTAILGWSELEIGRNVALWLPEVHPADRARLVQAVRRHLGERAPLDIEFRVRARQGGEHWLHAIGQAHWDDAGQPRQMAGIVFDVSHRRATEAALAAREQQLAGIVETAMDAIITVDAQQRIVVFNSAASQMFRIGAAQAIGQPLERFIPPALRAAHAGHVGQFARAGTTSRRMGLLHELSGLRSDGESFPIEASISRLDSGGQLLMTAVVRDVTDAREADRARAAQVAAEAASRAKSQMISRVSHELRNPLHALLGFLQLLDGDPRDPLSERQRHHVQLGRQAGWHLVNLIDDLLDVARIEAGELHVHLRPLRVGDVLADALMVSEPLAARHQVRLVGAPDDAGLRLSADPARLRQVLINLLSNGLKYNRPGGEVRVLLHAEPGWVHVDVVDNGLGMDAGQREHLFVPFNRLGREHSGIEGSGIGLALVKQLVTAMGGRIEVDSEAGRGTRVRVSLRAAPAGEPGGVTVPGALAPADGGEAAAPAQEQPFGVVLYIEDDPVNQLIVEQFLSRWPLVRLVVVDRGAAGLAKARLLQPDVVLLDMQLPDMSGTQVLQRLRADPATRGLRVVVLSANAMAPDIAGARDAGAQDYWAKPLDLAAFGRDLLPYLRRATVAAGPA